MTLTANSCVKNGFTPAGFKQRRQTAALFCCVLPPAAVEVSLLMLLLLLLSGVGGRQHDDLHCWAESPGANQKLDNIVGR